METKVMVSKESLKEVIISYEGKLSALLFDHATCKADRVTTDEDGKEVSRETTAHRITLAECIGNENAKNWNKLRKTLVGADASFAPNAFIAMAKALGVVVEQDAARVAVERLNAQLKFSSNGVDGVRTMAQLIDADAVIVWIEKCRTGNLTYEVWASKAEYKAATSKPCPLSKWSPKKAK